MNKIYPQKLVKGDEIRVIAPSRSMAIINLESREIANRRFEELGFKLSFAEHVNEKDDFDSTSIASRVQDLHQAFADKKVKAILTVIGGFNSNQLLRYIDWKLVQQNPKIFCGYSDITALNNAIYAKTGLVTYSGPHYSSFSQKLYFDYTLEYFKKCLCADLPFTIEKSQEWSDDPWYKDQDNRTLIANDGFWIINQGSGQGSIVGANLCTFNLLQGTEYFPKLDNSILFVEDDSDTKPVLFDRDLQSVIHQPDFEKVKGIVIGRFQKDSNITRNLLEQIIKSKTEFKNLPIIANVDFGHTDPKITIPIGGEAKLSVTQDKVELVIINH